MAVMAMRLWPLLLLGVKADAGCDPVRANGANGTMNSAPLLLQRPGVFVKAKNRSLHEAPTSQNFQWNVLVPELRWPVSLDQFGPAGVHHFFNAALIFDWCLFLMAASLAVIWRCYVKHMPLAPLSALGGWLGLGTIYATIIFVRMGSHHGSNLAGRVAHQHDTVGPIVWI